MQNVFSGCVEIMFLLPILPPPQCLGHRQQRLCATGQPQRHAQLPATPHTIPALMPHSQIGHVTGWESIVLEAKYSPACKRRDHRTLCLTPLALHAQVSQRAGSWAARRVGLVIPRAAAAGAAFDCICLGWWWWWWWW